MSLLYLVGSGYNQIGRTAIAAVPGSALSGYSAAALYSGVADQPFLFDGAPYTLDYDMNQVSNGDFSTAFVGGLPAASGWGKSSGATLTRDTSVYLSSPASLKVTGAGQYAYFDLEAAAGEVLTVSGAGQAAAILGFPPSALLGCQNLETGNWLNSAGAWQGAETHWASGPSAFALETLTFTVENYSTCKADRVTLRFRFLCQTPAPEAWFDDFFVWPRINFGFIHNHNFPPAVACGFRSGTSGFAVTTLRGLLSIAQPTMFVTMADVDERYWRFISTTPPDTRNLYMWQLVLGQYRTARRRQNYGQGVTVVSAQDRSSSDLGPRQAYLRAARERRRIEMQFRYNDADDYAEALEILERSRNGANPLLVVAESADPTSAMLCRVAPEWQHSRVTLRIRDASLQLEEFPFGIVAP